ncbi:MAG: hypothetical protein AAGD32_08020 [Planctomycetota bacterium]
MFQPKPALAVILTCTAGSIPVLGTQITQSRDIEFTIQDGLGGVYDDDTANFGYQTITFDRYSWKRGAPDAVVLSIDLSSNANFTWNFGGNPTGYVDGIYGEVRQSWSIGNATGSGNPDGLDEVDLFVGTQPTIDPFVTDFAWDYTPSETWTDGISQFATDTSFQIRLETEQTVAGMMLTNLTNTASTSGNVTLTYVYGIGSSFVTLIPEPSIGLTGAAMALTMLRRRRK